MGLQSGTDTEMLTEAPSGTGNCGILTGTIGILFFPPGDIAGIKTLACLLLDVPAFSRLTNTAALPQSLGCYSK